MSTKNLKPGQKVRVIIDGHDEGIWIFGGREDLEDVLRRIDAETPFCPTPSPPDTSPDRR